MQEFKVVLVGDGGVGKTSLIKRLKLDKFEKRYLPTVGVNVHSYSVQNNHVHYNIWDTAGQEKFGGLKNEYYENANLGIVMCANNSYLTQKSVRQWQLDIRETCGNIPIVIVRNKWDLESDSRSLYNEYYYDISVKNNTGITELLDGMKGLLQYGVTYM
jgi:GTP-binding nuclear protein Ran